jgi:hypothetical protein
MQGAKVRILARFDEAIRPAVSRIQAPGIEAAALQRHGVRFVILINEAYAVFGIHGQRLRRVREILNRDGQHRRQHEM